MFRVLKDKRRKRIDKNDVKVTDNKLSSKWDSNPRSSIRPEPADGALTKKIHSWNALTNSTIIYRFRSEKPLVKQNVFSKSNINKSNV